jgi:leucyl aminopeptidase
MLQIKQQDSFLIKKSSKEGTVVCLPFFIKKKKIFLAQDKKKIEGFFNPSILPKEFKGKRGEVLSLYLDEKYQFQVFLLGLGSEDELDQEEVKKAYGSLIKHLNKKELNNPQLLTPVHNKTSYQEAVLEAAYSANYQFDDYKKVKGSLLKSATIVGEKLSKKNKELKGIYQGIYLSRDLINRNADEADADFLSNTAKGLSKKYAKLQLKILGEKELKKAGCDLILAVNQASRKKPALIIFQYKGDSKSKKSVAIVGKGVTYDTGGLSLKSSPGMLNMKTDMSGAAAVFGAIESICQQNVKKNVIGVIPVVENCIGAGSYKVGDVFKGYNKKTVEVVNTDAEGRLILADALAYTIDKFNPEYIVDICTLTGAVVVALGQEAMGLMSNDDKLAEALMKEGQTGLDRVWRLPLFREYKKLLNSKIADMTNSGGREAASITAALFLKEFVGKSKWAHLDIAGVAYQKGEKAYLPKGATGVGVGLLYKWVQNT